MESPRGLLYLDAWNAGFKVFKVSRFKDQVYAEALRSYFETLETLKL
jgi:hypothetical protein